MKKLMITGNIGRDAESRVDQNGNQFAVFSVGVSVGTKQSPRTDWVEVTCNTRLYEFALKYLKRGTKVLVEGFPTVSPYLNKEGKAAASLRLSANIIELLGGKREDGTDDDSHEATIGDSNGSTNEHYNHGKVDAHASPASDIPF